MIERWLIITCLQGKTADEVAAGVVEQLELCGSFNAGFGSNLCLDGRVTCDSLLTDHTGLYGSVGGAEGEIR